MKKKKHAVRNAIIKLLVILIIAQWTASHLALWENTEGFDITKIFNAMDYMGVSPFDFKTFVIFTEFATMSYSIVYVIVMLILVNMLIKTDVPRGDADVRGKEQGSNHFMSKEEIMTYKKSRMTPTFEYSSDVRQIAKTKH